MRHQLLQLSILWGARGCEQFTPTCGEGDTMSEFDEAIATFWAEHFHGSPHFLSLRELRTRIRRQSTCPTSGPVRF